MHAVDLAQPWADLITGARGAVLATLVQLEAPVTVRALARHAGTSAQGALSLINDLAEAGVVHVQPAGKSLMVALNRDHLAATPLLALVRLRAELVSRLSDELASWDDLSGAWLFGSAARGDGSRDSDIDLLLVANRTIDADQWEDQVTRLRDQVRRWTGNPVQLVEHTRRSFTALVRAENPLIAAVRAEGLPLTRETRRLLRTRVA